ncbi:MAG: pyridoxamine 5'-phosphate oxidase family protein [Anaerolineae bacterium]|nr:pyridoxamine 5'-phosphate oxidase family protein [Anaerolineae bacterium]
MKHTWQDFAAASPDLASYGEQRLKAAPAYLATVRSDGSPRVHPVTPILGEGHLLLFMEPTSPKGHDLVRDPRYAMHCSVADSEGGAGEFHIRGSARLVDDPQMRAIATRYGYTPKDHYILFELSVEAAFSTVYGTDKPSRTSWKAT